MADVVVGAIVFLGVTLLLLVTIRAYNRRFAPPLGYNLVPWQLEERTEDDPRTEKPVLAVYCVHPGDDDLRVGAAEWGASDFDNQIEEARVEGQLKLQALNRPLRDHQFR